MTRHPTRCSDAVADELRAGGWRPSEEHAHLWRSPDDGTLVAWPRAVAACRRWARSDARGA